MIKTSSSLSQICDNWTSPIGPSQDYRVTATFVRRPHKSVSLSDPARSQVFALGPYPPPRHQAGQLVGEQQLRAEDLRLWVGARRRAGPVEAHDSGSGYAILPCTGNPDGCASLFSCRGCLVGRMHFRRTSRSSDPVPSTESGSTSECADWQGLTQILTQFLFPVGIDNRIVGDAVDGGHETCVRRCQNSHAPESAKAAFVVSSLHAKLPCDAWSRSFAVSNVGLWSGKHEIDFLNRHIVWLHVSYITQDKRISVIDALAHPYLDEGRLRYHSCMCKCCYTTSGGMRQYTADFEPAATQPFDDLWERKLTSVQQVKGKFARPLSELVQS